jgi:hypothetical protein
MEAPIAIPAKAIFLFLVIEDEITWPNELFSSD